MFEVLGIVPKIEKNNFIYLHLTIFNEVFFDKNLLSFSKFGLLKIAGTGFKQIRFLEYFPSNFLDRDIAILDEFLFCSFCDHDFQEFTLRLEFSFGFA